MGCQNGEIEENNRKNAEDWRNVGVSQPPSFFSATGSPNPNTSALLDRTLQGQTNTNTATDPCFKGGKKPKEVWLVYHTLRNKKYNTLALPYFGMTSDAKIRYSSTDIQSLNMVVLAQVNSKALAMGIESALIQYNNYCDPLSVRYSSWIDNENNGSSAFRQLGIAWLDANIPNWRTKFDCAPGGTLKPQTLPAGTKPPKP